MAKSKISPDTRDSVSQDCKRPTVETTPVEVHWCDRCRIPVIIKANQDEKNACPLCGGA